MSSIISGGRKTVKKRTVTMSAYPELEARFRRMSALGEAAGVLHWDRAVLMPEGGAAARSDQLAALAITRHEMITDDRLADLLDAAAEEVADDPWRAANVREMRRECIHASAVPVDLVEALSTVGLACEMKWREARAAADFSLVAADLAEVLSLVRENAAAKADALGVSPYEALMDQYEPGARTAQLDPLFADLAEFLPDFIEAVLMRQGTPAQALPPGGPFLVDSQRALGERLMERLGFDFDRGRLDVSLHPFCGGVPDDIRITTRYDQVDFTQSLMGVLHETGHALYEMGLPAKWRHQPVGGARGMALHESQSLLVEMQACRSREFIEFAAPLMRAAFDGSGPGWSVDNLYRHYTTVARSLIRVDADEVTYPAHVILRYRLERALIAGDMTVDDIPGAWNEAMVDLLQISPPDDARGCLQDIHWYDGTFGYFPTYTMGALAAAQLFEAARKTDPTIPQAISTGDFAPLMGWMAEHIHGRASSASTGEIIADATGAPLGVDAFRRHLTARYLPA
jgi:carboxypeptidase Taq